MMEEESWLKEEQDMEYSSEEATQLEDNMRMLDRKGTSEGRTAIVEVENLFKAMSIDHRRAKRWEKEEHDWLEDLDITMVEVEHHKMMESRRFVVGEECGEHLVLEDIMSGLSVEPPPTQGLADSGLLGVSELGCDICQQWWRAGRIICFQDQEMTSLLELRDKIQKLALETNTCPMYSVSPSILTVQFQGADHEPGQGGVDQPQAAGVDGEPGHAAVEPAVKQNIGKHNNHEISCSGPPESEGGEGGKQRKQDQVQNEMEDEVQDEVHDEMKEQVQASNQGRIVLVAGRGSSQKKRKDGASHFWSRLSNHLIQMKKIIILPTT